MTHYRIPMSSPDITDPEREAVMQVLQTPYLSIGPQIESFEESICQFTGSRNAVGVNSGTSGLHLCIRAAGIGSGDLVITTPFSFVASTNVILYEDAIPVFVDVDPLTGNMDPVQTAQAAHDLVSGGKAAERWLPKQGVKNPGLLKGMLVVDVFGQPADLDSFSEICRLQGIPLIEDSCEALGAEYHSRKAGTLGDFGVFAFYPNKQITTGEGGMVITDDDRAAELIRALRNQGRAPGDNWLQHTHLGYNYRLDELSAALGLAQMKRLDTLLNNRQRVADWYAERLAEIPEVEVPILVPSTTRVSWFVYVIRLQKGIDRSQVAAYLDEQGIPVRPYFLPIHLQPYMLERFGYQPGDYPVTEDLGERGLALPFSGKMTEEQINTVCTELHKAIMHS